MWYIIIGAVLILFAIGKYQQMYGARDQVRKLRKDLDDRKR